MGMKSKTEADWRVNLLLKKLKKPPKKKKEKPLKNKN